MVSITREDGEVSNELLSGITDNLKFFIENITCVRETFGFSQTTLSTQLNKTGKELAEFINHNKISLLVISYFLYVLLNLNLSIQILPRILVVKELLL